MNIIITEEKDLNDFIINQCKKNIDEYTIDFDKILNTIINKIKYKRMFLFIIYKDNKIYTVFSDGDSRKNKILEIVKKIFKNY